MMELSLKRPLSRSPLMLKDYLLDDLSSCSSNGFPSYPRRQCCTTVRFLLEIDLKTKPPKYNKKPLLQTPLKPASAPISAFQRASEAVIKAVRNLPFASLRSPTPSSSKLKLGILPRSLSRKFLKRSFWKKNEHKEIQQYWQPINHLAKEKSSPTPDFIIAVAGDSSNSSTSDSNGKSNSWSDSDFTISDDSLHCSTANSSARNKIGEEVVIENNKKRSPKVEVVGRNIVGVIGGAAVDAMDVTTTSSHSSTNSNSHPNPTKKQWPNDEKEQFSPVSVLDCPFQDDDDEVSSSSPFQRRLARMEGTKKRLMEKLVRFELLTQLEPVNLVKRIALSEYDQESNESPLHHSSESIQDNFVSDIEEVAEEDSQLEEKPLKMLELIKYTMQSINITPNFENLLLDFFKLGLDNISENAMELTTKCVNVTPHEELLLHIPKDWLNGQPIEQLLGWEVKEYREAYIRDMERGGERRNLDKEKQEVTLEIEGEVFASLMNELLDDLL